MNINYISAPEYKFDLEIIDGDLNIVDDERSIKIDILNAVMTHLGELENLFAFKKLGSKIYEIPKMLNTEMTKYLLQEYIRESIEKLPTINYVENIQIIESDEDTLKININVVDNEYQEFNIKL